MRKQTGGVISGLIWSFAERIAAQLVSTIVGIVLARLLMPEDYGLISIVMVFISFCDVFVTTGFCSAVVQKKEADEADFNTAFLLSLGIGLLLYICLFCIAPIIADLYDLPQLCLVIRVLGIRLLITSLNAIQQSYIRRNMLFRKLFVATIGGTMLSCIVGITMAFSGYGVWALVAQYLTNVLISTIVLLFVSEWKPKLQFSVKKAKEIFSFGWKVLCTELIATLENDIRSLIVGKVFGPADLAYYDQGRKYPALLMVNISTTIDKVMLPTYSVEQENKNRILSMLRRSVRIGIFALTPILLGFAVVAKSFAQLLLTDKWLPCVPFIQVFCLAYLTRPLESSCRQALLAIGKSGAVLSAMVIIHVVALFSVMVSVFLFESVFCIALSSILTTLVSLGCFLTLSWKYLNYTFKMQIQDTLPSLAIGVIMSTAVFTVGRLEISTVLLLVLQIFTGGIVYIGCSAIFRLEPLMYLLGMFKKRCERK